MATNTGKRIWYATNEGTKSGFSGLPIPIYLAKKWTGGSKLTETDPCKYITSGGYNWYWFFSSDASTLLNGTDRAYAVRVEPGWIEYENGKYTYPEYTTKDPIPLGVTVPTGDQRYLIGDGLGLVGPFTRQEVTKAWWTLNSLNIKGVYPKLTADTSAKQEDLPTQYDYSQEPDFSKDELERANGVNGSYNRSYAIIHNNPNGGDPSDTLSIESDNYYMRVYCDESKMEEFYLRLPIRSQARSSDETNKKDHVHYSLTQVTNVYHPKILVADGSNIIKQGSGCKNSDNTWSSDICPYDNGESSSYYGGGFWSFYAVSDSLPGKKEVPTSSGGNWNIKLEAHACTKERKDPDGDGVYTEPCKDCQGTRVLYSSMTKGSLKLTDVKIKINDKEYNTKCAKTSK